MPSLIASWCLALVQTLGPGAVDPTTAPEPHSRDTAWPKTAETRPAAAHGVDAMLAALDDPRLLDLAREVLERNPDIARAQRLVEAAESRVEQAGSLPDPTAAVSLFALPPETRVGPQRLSASVQQMFPWFGKRELAGQVAADQATAMSARVETMRLDVLTELRRLLVELAFLDVHDDVVDNQRSTLARYEQAAQARYAAGSGLQQGIVRIQAQITRVDARGLEIAERRAALRSQINRLRARPANTPVDVRVDLAERYAESLAEERIDTQSWTEMARSARPELRAVQARIDAANSGVELAQKQKRPDVGLGLAYTVVDGRRDTPGRLAPPEDDGDDVLAFTGSIRLPVWRDKLDAAVDEAQAVRWAAEEEKRSILADIDSSIGDVATRLPLLREHLDLLEGVLIKQAEEALRSAEIAYRTGRLNAVDLLDAEVVLFEVQVAAARTRADVATAWIQAERAVGAPLRRTQRTMP